MQIAQLENHMSEEELRRNCLTIRFRDREHRAVSDEAWRNRMTMSGWMRDLALDHLREQGKLEQE